ncbi:DnaD domain protein [Staphylospora marina]|uniref:DnaD domain protein n=1 Tax=Staphylospora marina TaxID=2490858 RepID=UPI000F5BE343|nr:DnaD domain protein [Staphylospora marina]
MNGQEHALRELETMDPIRFFEQYTGESVPRQLAQLIVEIKRHYRFPNGVINGMLEYCLLQKEHRITRSFVLELADMLKEAKVKNGREAFALLKQGTVRQAEENKTPCNEEYVEINIALLARQLHELRREIHRLAESLDSRLDRIEKRLAELEDMFE